LSVKAVDKASEIRKLAGHVRDMLDGLVV